ncbi:glycosyltransferase family 4 protein [Rhizobium sp. 18055]|uniref:glycosyltransferase family 4 protein n=1 Tax=Rhizobium sp. 18055 TaxID=2681403 RepID=UPI0013596645|nr:glycosyltransferase family 4 protein [Rhizobium sp. 18055]
MSLSDNELDPEIEIFVHLATAQDAREWARKWDDKTLVGINDPSPYGYSRAEKMGCRVTFSQAMPEWFGQRMLRLAVRSLFGFDFIHAWRNAHLMKGADAVWTHTESQFLAVAALLRLRGNEKKRPRLIGQAVWLFDNWKKLSFVHRWIYGWLIKDLDVLIIHSEENARIARELFPKTRVELVLFGIPNERPEPLRIQTSGPIKVLCLGNDRDRDWKTAIRALGNQAGLELTIVSSSAKRHLTTNAPNIRIITVSNNTELRALFAESTLMLVPLKPNMHASGITVVQEAALLGLPILATDTGGLRSYFDDESVVYVPPHDADAILAAVRRIGGQPELRERLALAAQTRATSGEIGCDRYICRHVELTSDVLNRSVVRT